MLPRIAADALVLAHLAFVIFVLTGAFLIPRWPGLAALHLPAVAWGILVEWNAWYCPLTPWEQALRHAAGEAGYQGGFVEHYVLPLLYPLGLTAATQAQLAVVVVVVNAIGYGLAVRAWRTRHR